METLKFCFFQCMQVPSLHRENPAENFKLRLFCGSQKKTTVSLQMTTLTAIIQLEPCQMQHNTWQSGKEVSLAPKRITACTWRTKGQSK